MVDLGALEWLDCLDRGRRFEPLGNVPSTGFEAIHAGSGESPGVREAVHWRSLRGSRSGSPGQPTIFREKTSVTKAT